MVEETIKNESKISEILFDLSQIQEEMKHNLSNNYFNNHAVISSTIRKPLLNLVFTLQDILLIGALTCSSVLLSGSSGSGKTLLAELVSTFLFGKEGYTRKNITPDMNEQDFMDIDFGAIKEGKKLKEALLADQLFTRPVIIIDEANRAPPIVQNRLLQILENNIDLKSKKIKAGIKLENGEFYQWDILTLNLGQEYAGTSTVDRALRDRITIDIPIDNFPPTLDDQIKMIRKSSTIKGISSDNCRQSVIFKTFQLLDDISLSLEAEALLLYLSFTSNCIKSPTKSKFGINFSPTYCKMKDCPYARNPPLNEICPFTYAPSNRVLRKVIQVAKGFNILRHT
ncbi:MAG: AAA family ATPase, partial [Promethearchaeota archaeon]